MENLASMNNDNRGITVILQMKVDSEVDGAGPGLGYTVKIAQIGRLFVNKFLRYTSSPTEFEEIKRIYMITTDVDLLPLTAKSVHDYSHDWYIINHDIWEPEKGRIYFALSSIGAFINIWETFIVESDYPEISSFNGTGIISQ